MNDCLPLFRGYTDDAPIGWRNGHPVRFADFMMAARRMARAFPDTQYTVNLCEDRLLFLLGWAASLIAGKTVLLPPNRTTGGLRQLDAYGKNAVHLVDRGLPAPTASVFSLDPTPFLEAGASGGPKDSRDHGIARNHLAVVVFTSGSTGEPQPHEKRWEMLVSGASALGRSLRWSEESSTAPVVGTIPPQHMFGLETTIMLPTQWGRPIHPDRPFFAEDIKNVFASLSTPGWLMSTPLHLRACVEAGRSIPAVRGVVSATMPLEVELARQTEALLSAPVWEVYGCTEAGAIGYRRPATHTRWYPLDDIEVHVTEEGAFVSGPRFEGQVALADRLELHADHLFTLGPRVGDIVKIAGKRTSLSALNAVLRRIPGVEDGLFYPADDSPDSRLAAVAVAPGRTAAELLEALREEIDPAFLPRPFHVTTVLPRNELGKLPLEELRALAQANPGRRKRADNAN